MSILYTFIKPEPKNTKALKLRFGALSVDKYRDSQVDDMHARIKVKAIYGAICPQGLHGKKFPRYLHYPFKGWWQGTDPCLGNPAKQTKAKGTLS